MNAPTLSDRIAAEHAAQEAERGAPVSRSEVVRGLLIGGLLRADEWRAHAQKEAARKAAFDAEFPPETRAALEARYEEIVERLTSPSDVRGTPTRGVEAAYQQIMPEGVTFKIGGCDG